MPPSCPLMVTRAPWPGCVCMIMLWSHFVVHTCNQYTWKAEARELQQAQGQSRLYNAFLASLGQRIDQVSSNGKQTTTKSQN